MDEFVKTTVEQKTSEPPRQRAIYWLKRIGLAGFLFYLIKGLLWIIIPVLVARGCL